VRIGVVATIAGLSLRWVWSGTTPLIVLAGMALWIAALDAAEPLGQEIDHPGRTDTYPFPRGELFAKHLPIAFAVSGVTGLIAGAVAAVPFGASVPVGPALIAGVVAGILAAAGATVSVVQGAPDPTDTLAMATPEIAGTRTVYRTALPPALAVLGTTPLLAARASVQGIEDPPPVSAAMTVAIFLLLIPVLVFGWVRFRDAIRKTMADATDQLSPTKAVERQREERLAEEAREAEALAESRRIAAEGGAPASRRAKARTRPSPAPSHSPPGVQGGTSSKPIGRKRDQT
jgi:hypothetical protein